MNNQQVLLKRLQRAINACSEHKILVSKNEWYSDKRQAEITSYVIRLAIEPDDKSKGRKKTVELFSTTSLIQAVLYLRDYWYSLTDKEIPTDNEYWNDIKIKKGLVIDAKTKIFN